MRDSTLARHRLLGTVLLLLSGCSNPGPGPDPQSERPREMRDSVLVNKPLERAPAAHSSAAVTGEVPETLLERMRADLRARVGADRTLVLARAESTVWPNGGLGCPIPGMMYTQALVPGYHVVFEVGGKRWDYRASEGGAFRLCETAVPGMRQSPHPAS